MQAELNAQLVLGGGAAEVDLVAEHEERHLVQLLARQQCVELLLRLLEAVAVVRVDEEDDGVDLREVVLPDAPRDLVPAQVERAELDLRDRELLRRCAREEEEEELSATAALPAEVRGARAALGCCVGLCCDRRSSFSMCSSVVFPALSRPRNRILAFLLARPAAQGELRAAQGARRAARCCDSGAAGSGRATHRESSACPRTSP